jgi:hypothetical protein
MEILKENFYTIMLVLSTVLVAASMIRYIYSILGGKTKPNIVGWLLYQIATICVLIGAYELGSVTTIALTLVFSVTQLIVIILSFRYGFVRFSGLESFYFGFSMVVLLFWIVARHDSALMSALHLTERGLDIALITANTLIECMGAIAIFTKLYHHPETEDHHAWLLSWLGGLAAIIAANSLAYEDLLYPVYLFTTNLAIWLLCFRRKPRGRFKVLFEKLEKVVGGGWRH